MSTLPILSGFVDIHLQRCLPIVSTLPIPQGFVPLSSNASISLLGSSAPVHSRNSSWLFRIPTELRRLIYGQLLGNDFEGTHLWLDASSKIAWSRCVGLDEVSQRHLSLRTHEDADEQEKSNARQRQWSYRVSSPWGGHWECEEYRHQEDAFGNELTCCQLMYSEFAKYVFGNAIVHITDVNTLDALANPTFDLSSMPSYAASSTSSNREMQLHPNEIKTLVFAYQSIRHLSISLCLPFLFYSTQDSDNYDSAETSSMAPKLDSSYSPVSLDTKRGDQAKADHRISMFNVTSWKRLPLVLNRMPGLCSLDIRLDQTGSQPWASVNERAVLGDLGASELCKRIQVRLYLPELEEEFADPAKHIVHVSTSPTSPTSPTGPLTSNVLCQDNNTATLAGGDSVAFTIHRRQRFSYFAGREDIEAYDKDPWDPGMESFWSTIWPYWVAFRSSHPQEQYRDFSGSSIHVDDLFSKPSSQDDQDDNQDDVDFDFDFALG
ncbi:hypothetical protein SCAR479_09301 [Seiridium cardinale]|uniref:F-box domain-containing protein n=1 Tax=Seiridium cardinale TaxID=138064 RepID=A0ABR2XJN2_9PEZI